MAKKKLYTSGIVYSTDPKVVTTADMKEESETLLPKEQLLSVKTDGRHRGGKIVTVVEGFSGTSSDLETLGKQLKSHCGTGGSVKNNEILVQGDNAEKIIGWLKKNGFVKAVRK